MAGSSFLRRWSARCVSGGLALLLCTVAALATPRMGEQCTACHFAATLPPSHPMMTGTSSAICVSCHTADQTETQDRTRTQDRDQQQEQARTQDRTRAQVRLGGDRGGIPMGGAAEETNRAEEARRSDEGAEGSAEGAHHGAHAHGHHGDDPWSFRLRFGLLYSSDLEQHRSGYLFDLGHEGGHGGGDGDGGHDAGESDPGGWMRIGGRVGYSVDLGARDTIEYLASLDRDIFTEDEPGRTIARFGARWTHKADGGRIVVYPYVQRTMYDPSSASDGSAGSSGGQHGSGGSDGHGGSSGGHGAGSGGDHSRSDFTALALNLNYHHFLTEQSTLSYTFRAKNRRYDSEDEPRGTDLRAGLTYQGQFENGRPYRVGLLLQDRNNSKRDHRRYYGQTLSFGTQWEPDANAILGLYGELGHRGYKAVDPDEGKTRDDWSAGIGLSYLNSELRIFETSPSFTCFASLRASNIPEYDTNSGYCAVLLERHF